MTTEMKAAEIVLDYNLYPRHKIDSTHVLHIRSAMRAGEELPPVLVDKASKRAIDGFHRITAALREFGEDATIRAELREYDSEAEMLLDAIRTNSGHGHNLSTYDRVRCMVLADEFKVSLEDVATALRCQASEAKNLKLQRTVSVGNGQITPIKHGLRHLAKRSKLSAKQAEGNQAYGGLSPTYYVNEVVRILSYDLADWRNPGFVGRLAALREILNGLDFDQLGEKAG